MKKNFKERLKERVEAFNKDEEEIAIYSDYTRGELEHNTELEDAHEEGKMEKALETAKNFLKLGIKPEIIAKGTGLSLSEINMLR